MVPALVLVDLQERIVRESWRPRTGQAVAATCLRLASAARQAGRPVIAVQSWRLDARGDRTVVDGDELVAGLLELATDVVTKHSWGAFGGTTLDAVLRHRGVNHLFLGGIATNFGVESTARAADDLGYRLTLIEDAMTSTSDEAHSFAIREILGRLGTVADERAATEALVER
ncbi:cysteine hydrolase family protein [Geodermatophilus sp. SYSU D00700]